jgi:uncharacterized protein (UPF0548 family)
MMVRVSAESPAAPPHLPLWQQPVTYAAIGATAADDLLRHPPAGYRPIRRRARIGHGEERFEYACVQTMSWGIQRASGFLIDPVDVPVDVARPGYTPVEFDEQGRPTRAALLADREQVFASDGTPMLAAGDTVLLRIPLGPARFTAPARVVYVVSEPNRVGFAYGTLPGHPEDGEEAFVVDRKDDGSVWITITAFSRPSSRRWWAVYPVLRVVQEYYTRRYLRALAVPID